MNPDAFQLEVGKLFSFCRQPRFESNPLLKKYVSEIGNELFVSPRNGSKLHVRSIIQKSLSDDDVRITHDDNPAFWNRKFNTDESGYGRVAKLISVCWLHVSCQVHDVPPGNYIAFVRIKCSGRNFCGNWRVGTGSRSIRQFAPDRVMGDYEAITFIRSNDKDLPIGEWVYVTVGTVAVSRTSAVEVLFLGGNPYWTCSILFDHVGLIPVGIGWDIRRLFLLGMGYGGERHHCFQSLRIFKVIFGRNRPCLFRKLHKDCIIHILQYL